MTFVTRLWQGKHSGRNESGEQAVSMTMSDNRQAKFDALVDIVHVDLYRYAHWRCRDRLLAEDLVQETLLRAWKNIGQLKSAQAAKAWVFMIFRREFARQLERGRLDLVDMALVGEYELPSTASGSGDLALREALARLDSKYSEPLVLQVLGGFSCSEIAGITNLSETAVMTRLFRARKQLRELLGDDSVSARDVSTVG